MPLHCSYKPNYFLIEDILASEERITCKIESTLPRLGFLDTSSDDENLNPGSKLDLPIWLASDLLQRNPQRAILSIDLPKVYKDSYREILQAGASSVLLSKWNPYYYELGMELSRLPNPECQRLNDSLMLTFKSRFRLIMDWAQNPVSDPTLANQLPLLEKQLFLASRKGKILLNEWLKRGVSIIETSKTATHLKKRKRLETDFS